MNCKQCKHYRYADSSKVFWCDFECKNFTYEQAATMPKYCSKYKEVQYEQE